MVHHGLETALLTFCNCTPAFMVRLCKQVFKHLDVCQHLQLLLSKLIIARLCCLHAFQCLVQFILKYVNYACCEEIQLKEFEHVKRLKESDRNQDLRLNFDTQGAHHGLWLPRLACNTYISECKTLEASCFCTVLSECSTSFWDSSFAFRAASAVCFCVQVF